MDLAIISIGTRTSIMVVHMMVMAIAMATSGGQKFFSLRGLWDPSLPFSATRDWWGIR